MFLVFTDLFKIFHSKTNPVAGVRPFLTLKRFALCKEIQDSLGFWIPRRGFRILVTGFQSLSMELRFRILIFCAIPDSKTQHSGVHSPRKFLGFRDPDSLTWGETFFCSINVHTIAAGHVSENALYTDLFCQKPASMHLYDNYRGFPYLVKVMLGCFEFPF